MKKVVGWITLLLGAWAGVAAIMVTKSDQYKEEAYFEGMYGNQVHSEVIMAFVAAVILIVTGLLLLLSAYGSLTSEGKSGESEVVRVSLPELLVAFFTDISRGKALEMLETKIKMLMLNKATIITDLRRLKVINEQKYYVFEITSSSHDKTHITNVYVSVDGKTFLMLDKQKESVPFSDKLLADYSADAKNLAIDPRADIDGLI
ncbi:hypothetical protein [Paenibacillus tianjinensis]|uniref:Uncharacterized protein n=1 Tax=Paenibacillus tianjinensis TaxID=2810347 RepID=A0ABX7LEK8_9BACL|nr:hypothetical protein [Paenibacillus tianjinensis]QSF45283.1 hypothetical protein JRJ22_00970 [Paenibacillus tianjinensis]